MLQWEDPIIEKEQETLSGIFKRSKNLAKARLNETEQKDVSAIESIHQMKDKLSVKRQTLSALLQKTEASSKNHSSLVSEWDMRRKAATDHLVSLPENSTKRNEVDHLRALADKYYEIHIEGQHDAERALSALKDNLAKIDETLGELQAVTNRYELNKSLMAASESMGKTKVLYTQQEADDMNRIAYSAKALISLKESDLVMPDITTNAKAIEMENDFNKLEGA